IARADRVVVAANAADAAGDEVGVAGILAPHEHAVAAEQRRGALARDHFAVGEVDLRVDAKVADDPGDRIPGHVDELAGLGLDLLGYCHLNLLLSRQDEWVSLLSRRTSGCLLGHAKTSGCQSSSRRPSSPSGACTQS